MGYGINDDHYFSKLGVFKFILLFILSILFSVMILAPYLGFAMVQAEGPISEAMTIFLSSLGLYLGILLFIWWLSLTREDRRAIWKPAPARSPRRLGFTLAPFLLGLPVNIIYILLLDRFFPDFLERMMDAGNLPANFMSNSDPLSLILLFLAVVVMAPIVEEIAFRGVLYNLLNKSLPLWLSAVISSVIFGLLHGTTFLQTAVIGFVLAFVYQVTGDLKMAILGHAVNNGLAFVQAILLAQGVIVEGQQSELIFTIGLLAMGTLMVIATISYLKKNRLKSIFNDRSPMYKHEIWQHQNRDQAQSLLEKVETAEDPTEPVQTITP